MKWKFTGVLVLCTFIGILSLSTAEEDQSTVLPSTTPSFEAKDETISSVPTTLKTEIPSVPTTVDSVAVSTAETTPSSPEQTETVSVQSTATPEVSGDGSPDSSQLSTVPSIPEVTATNAVTSETSEVSATPTVTPGTSEVPTTPTVASETSTATPEDFPTTTAESWFSWMYSSSDGGETGTTVEMSSTTATGSSESTTTAAAATTEVPVTSTTPAASVSTVTSAVTVSTTPSPSVLEKSQGVAFKLSDQVRAILQHYKNPDPTGFPGAPIPDPMLIPDMDKSFGVAKMTFHKVHVYGLSKFRIEQVNTDVEKMQVYVQLHMKRLVVLGNYTLRSWFNKAAGPFIVNLYDVVAEGAAALEPDEQGHLEASDSDMDMSFKDINLDFQNIGFAGTFFQGMVSSVGSFLFDSIKPHILKEVNTNMRRDVNAKIKTITSKLPSYVSPVDLAVSEGRKYVIKMGYDPYHLKDFQFQQSIVHINVSELWLKGLSQFYRVNDISLSMDNNTVQIGIQLVTRELVGSCSWTVALGRRGKLARTGVSNFTVEHLQIRAFVNQSLDIRHGPVLDDLDLEVGKVKLTMDGRGSLDYVIEIVVNQLPDLIRHIIVDVLEEPIRNKVQSILDQVNLEQIVESKLPELDQFS